MADDLDLDGPTAAVLAGCLDDPAGTVPGLRLLGSLHRLVLQGRAPVLAPFYPSVGGPAPVHEAWPAARLVIEAYAEELTELVRRPVQTNETGTCALLFAGLQVVTQRFDAPIRLLEVGASAGLTLNVDRYGYVVHGRTYGDPASPLQLREPWHTPPQVDLGHPLQLVDRRGCDRDPIDPRTPEGALTLGSYVWADDVERLARLRAALSVATQYPTPVDASAGSRWLPRHIGWPRTDAVSVIWHSVEWQYLDRAERAELTQLVAEAGERATATAPLALLRFEPRRGTRGERGGPYRFELRLTTWPGGRHEVLASAPGHGVPADWLG